MFLKYLLLGCSAICWNTCMGQKVDNKKFQKMVQYDSQGRLLYFPNAINADVVKKGEFQNFVSIQTNTGNHLCGAMMLDVDFVITTASCVTKASNNGELYTTSELQVMNDALQNKTVQNVNRIFRHPEFDYTTLDNNVAMLNIQPFQWSKDIEMLTAIDIPDNFSNCKVIGWGKSGNDEPFLQKILANITEDANCNEQYHYDHSNKICVQGQNNSCLEEPGSGLICDEELIGVLSFGNTCTEKGQKQLVYTDLTKYNVWIDEVFRTVITKTNNKNEPSLTTQAIEKVEDHTITPSTTQFPTTETYRPTINQHPTLSSSVPNQQSENDGHWAYQIVLDTCQLSFVTCEPVWSNYQINIECKRGYFPYGCFHVVKRFVKDEPFDNIGRAVENNTSNRLFKFKTYLKKKPLTKIQKTAENIFDTEKWSRAGFENTPERPNYGHPVVLSPFNQWFQRVFCLPVLQFKHFNNFPQHIQWRTDCDRFQPYFPQPIIHQQTRGTFPQKDVSDTKIYFPDDDVLSGNQQ